MYRSKKKLYSGNVNDKEVSLIEYTYYKDDKINYFNYAVNISFNKRTIYGCTRVQNEKMFVCKVSPCNMNSTRRCYMDKFKKINFDNLPFNVEVDHIINKIL